MKRIFGNILRFFIRVSAFLRKEIFAVVRQPRLILTLVLGPFLILLLFGIGYKATAQSLRTVFVASEDSEFRPFVDQYANQMGPLLENVGTVTDRREALDMLQDENVDLVIELPTDPVEKVRNSEHPVFLIYHDRIDPYEVEYVDAFARIFADEINRRVLTDVAASTQEDTASVQESVSATRQAAGKMRQALEQGDRANAMLEQNALVQNLDTLTLALGTSTRLVSSFGGNSGNPQEGNADLAQQLASLRDQAAALDTIAESEDGDYSEEIERVATIEEDAAELEEALSEFRSIEPSVLASPFDAEVRATSSGQLDFADFYVPAAIALLAQHMALTFAALSIVREELSGAIELFRVSPLAPFEGLLGKYISYFILTGLLLAILTALSLFGLQVPMLGEWSVYVLTVIALVFAALGAGFVISLLSQTTTQAVQYAMIVLLASIFFGGFFLGLDLLQPYVRVVSWALPATYGTQLLQDVMLRGAFTRESLVLLLGLFGWGLFFFLLALILLRRKMAQL